MIHPLNVTGATQNRFKPLTLAKYQRSRKNCSERDTGGVNKEDGDGLDKVLDAVLVRNARFCPVLLTLVNEPEEEIEAAGVITDYVITEVYHAVSYTSAHT